MTETAEKGLPIYPCCDHCIPEQSGWCWAVDVGHGAYCLDCQTPNTRPIPPGETSTGG